LASALATTRSRSVGSYLLNYTSNRFGFKRSTRLLKKSSQPALPLHLRRTGGEPNERSQSLFRVLKPFGDSKHVAGFFSAPCQQTVQQLCRFVRLAHSKPLLRNRALDASSELAFTRPCPTFMPA